jgi:XTP/dITP diphosphohydrolase
LLENKGHQGFGYDPIFVPDNHEITFAEMLPEEKNKISHRKLALDKFLDFINP